jgi:hypothetical protein
VSEWPKTRKRRALATVVADAACRRCRFRVEWRPRVPNPMVIVRCQRYPQAVEISDDYWCGEYKERSEPLEEKVDVPGNPGDQVVPDERPGEP